jgi:hypothetical protein
MRYKSRLCLGLAKALALPRNALALRVNAPVIPGHSTPLHAAVIAVLLSGQRHNLQTVKIGNECFKNTTRGSLLRSGINDNYNKNRDTA